MNDEQESERARAREINSVRFNWHQRLIADPELHRGAAALAFAGLILHTFDHRSGYAQVSISYACAKLRMPAATAHRGRRLLLRRGWIVPWSGHSRKRRGLDMASRYTLGGGPDDLILDAHQRVDDDTPAADGTLG